MASVKMKPIVFQVLGLAIVLICSSISVCYGLRFGEKSQTLHVPLEKNHQLPSITYYKDDPNLKPISSRMKTHYREKRAPIIDNDKKLISVFALNDSHEQLSVHWAGKGSKIIICLARSRKQMDGDTSRTFFSYDYGETFTEQQQKNMRLSAAKESLISMFYISPVVNSHYIFTDTVHKYVFITKDYGKTFQSAIVPFKPEILSLHPTDSDVVLGMEKNDPLKKLWYSDNFGITWKTISENIKAFIWGEEGIDPVSTLFVQRQEPGRSTSTIISTTTFFANEQRKHVLLSDVEDFEVRGKYMFATKRPNLLGSKNRNGTLQLWVSYNRKGFTAAVFPNRLEKQDFYIADASEDQVFACVMHTPKISNLYISDMEGTVFSLSLKRILYFSPAGAGKDLWSSDIPIVDLHKVEGLRGIYIATQLREDFLPKFNESSKLIGLEETDVADGLSSVITFNKGGEWTPLRPPGIDSRGEAMNCSNTLNCSLHVTQKFSQVYPRSRSPPILSRASAPGLILASGVVGASLKGHPSLFVSSDAGLNWHQVLYGNYLYSMGDHGGLVVAAEYYNEQGSTDHIMYSIDEGEHWSPLKFFKTSNDKASARLRIYGIMTEPGEKTTVFTLFGSDPDHHQWQLIKVDLKSVFDKSCSVEDYKHWSPHGFGKSCLLGRKDVYERRMSHISCYNGEEYIRPIISENCPCAREDYECFVSYVEDENKKCVKNPIYNFFDPYIVPRDCPEDTFYKRTKGYRLIAGDLCTGREKSGFEPDSIPCPIKDESEFLLFAQRQKISRIPLNGDNSEKDETTWEKLPLEDLRNIIAVDYDFKDRCVYWGDIDEDKIIRLCLEDGHSHNDDENKGKPEILVETALASVEGLAFDWVSRNLYFVDGELKKVEVIMVDLHNSGRMRRTILDHITLDKPRGIALHPYKGYMFLTDWSDSHPKLARTRLDGTEFKVLFDSSVVSWPNGIAVDFQGERIYWADAKRDYVASSDFEGNNMKKILEGSETVPHPFAVGVYKDWLYFDDWNRRQIVMANKYDGTGIKVIARNVLGAMDMKVFSKLNMDGSLGTNVCANRTAAKCSHLCMAKPPSERTCLCPDGMVITKLSDGSENCTCPGGESVLANGTCTSVSLTCAPDQFKCSEKTCIPNIWKCDGDNDCGDNSDEAQCGTTSCDNTQFQCKNGKCIPSSWKCDVDKDCTDGSDEENCHYPSCATNQFSCKNGHCIEQKYVCDFDDDCRDGSDESNCTGVTSSCPPTEFSCLTSNGGSQCLPLSWRCDGDKDCPDGSDETNCSINTCQAYQMRCKNGRCIYATWKCDGEDDCHDNSDEFDCNATTTITPNSTMAPASTPSTGTCSSWMFTCTNKNCIPYWWRCDGVDDCGDNTDESLCKDTSNTSSTVHPNVPTPTPSSESCGENRFKCDSGKCIWNSWVCDDTVDCPGGEDEKNCHGETTCPEDHFRCERSSGCIPKSDVCNGKSDCGDGSDEQACSASAHPFAVTCQMTDYTCHSGECIPYFERCDDHWDCIDGSDEDSCDTTEIIHVRNLLVDSKSIKPNGFNLTWSTPTSSHGNGTDFEYLPSYHEMDSLENQWTNTTWTDKNYQKLKNLVPGTLYKLTLYVRTKANPKKEYPTAAFAEAKTLSSAPNPPANVTLSQNPGERTIIVKWDKPDLVNGRISQYKIYFSPPYPPYIVMAPVSQGTTFSVNFKFEPGTNYSFWVTALSNEMESMNSHVATIVFAKDAVIDPIRNLTLVSKTNISISLRWEPPVSFEKASKEHSNSASSANSCGYSVAFKTNYLLDNYPWTVRNTTDTKIIIQDLAPGAKHTVKVTPFNSLFMGPETRLDVTTDGDPLPIVSGIKTSVNGTNITLSWNQPKDKRKAEWEYGIFIVQTADEIPIMAARTKSTSATLSGLDACVIYTLEVRVTGPFGLGSAKGLLYVNTQFDKKAPPKNVHVTSIPDVSTVVNVSWDSPCQEIDQDIGYKIIFYEKSLNNTRVITTKASNKNHLTSGFQVHWGAEYEVTVQTDTPGSRPTGKLLFRAKSLPVPTQVDAVPEQNGSLYIRWKEVDWPEELKDHNFTYVVSVGHDSTMKKVKHYNISKPPFVIDSMEKEIPYYVAVSVQDEHGYQSPLSEISSAAYPAGALALIFSTSNVVSVVVPIVLVIVGLAGALGFFVMRHKRLQRSFMSFANSHYDTRSGSATFTTGQDDDHLDEDDSPMIRGFSDDEPLVIA